MASGAASTCGASQLVTSASPTGGSFQAPSDAPRVEHAQELRRALNGEWYTREEFREYYQQWDGRCSAWWWYWDRAVWEAAAPGAASTGGVSSSDARAAGGKLMKVPLPPKGAPPEAGAEYLVKATSSGSEEGDSVTGDASQLAMVASATGGSFQAPSGALLVELGQERQQAPDGRWCMVAQAVPIPSPSAPSPDCPVCHGPPDLTSSDVPCPKCRGLTTDSAVAPVSFERELNSLLHLQGFSDVLVLQFPPLDASASRTCPRCLLSSNPFP